MTAASADGTDEEMEAMKPVRPPLTATQSRGRTFFICALLFVSSVLFQSVFDGITKGGDRWVDQLFTGAIYLLVLTLAFRGGQVSLTLIKGCFGVFAAIIATALFLIMVLSFWGDFPPLNTGRNQTTIKTLAFFLGLSYTVWALFASCDVKEFINYQREKRR